MAKLVAVTVVCVLRSGGGFLPEHVRMLLEAVRQHWPHTVPCESAVLSNVPNAADGLAGVQEIPLTYPWPGWWSKMELFRPALGYLGDLLYFDLDTMIVGDLTDIALVRKLTLLADFFRPARLGSGLMFLPLEERDVVWEKWLGAPTMWMGKLRGDQDFLTDVYKKRPLRWQTILPGQVVSYKAHIQKAGAVPAGARVVCFHGRPRPWNLKGGLPL